jgi:subtilase family serine protease
MRPPAQAQAHYGVQAGIKAGLDGTGQTIIIVDGPSDPTVQGDLVAFSKATGLPAITSVGRSFGNCVGAAKSVRLSR